MKDDRMMRVMAVGEHYRIAEELRQAPSIGPGELLIAVEAAGLCGTDLFKLDQRTVPIGTVLGHEIVGRVAEVGEGVTHLETGDRVVVPHHVACGVCRLCRLGAETSCPTFVVNRFDPGGFSELTRIDAEAVTHAARRLPDSIADEAAVFLEPAACVLRGIHRARLAEHHRRELAAAAVVLGAGSMGLLHVLVLRAAAPLLPILVVEPMPQRRQLALELGATASAESMNALRPDLDEITGGDGADAVFDTAGLPASLEEAAEALRPGGTLLLFAHFPPGARPALDWNRLFKLERRVVGSYSGSLSEQDEIFELLLSGRLDPSPLVTHRLPLTDLGDAIDLCRRREALKILLDPAPA